MKQFELQVIGCVIAVVLNVSLDDICGDLVANRASEVTIFASEVTIFPEFTAPKLTFDLRLLLKNRVVVKGGEIL